MEDEEYFSNIGGARINMMNATFPYAELTVFRDALRLTCVADYVFPKENIVSLTRYRGLLSVGLQIQHNVPTYPEFIVFWVQLFRWGSGFSMLKRRLEAFGYEVKV
ncbi:hypothetical protein JQ596_21000 [Bradyrhizobium manausense]|uniref:hypothetical protein n=1 Tax=Bradyrhizobium TaxID=374 RepID=UPI001BA5F5D8|nr:MULTISPECIES: hypothetical protein [Bradyrhizobium]MBR0828015.1 hypothetical protein [Bradyrhizobium manausense]UVO32878.1 hypothetical protein KUF59_20800 [Bradyrhizobium arachidis]